MKKYTMLLILSLGLAACGNPEETNNHDHDEVTPAEDACEHMVDGPAEAITAVEAGGMDAPNLSASHTRYDLTIPSDPASGDIAFEISEETEAHFFFGGDVDLTVADAGGAEVSPAETITSVDACDEVVEGFAYDLGVGTYTLTVDGASEVGMVYVPGGEEHHEHEHE